MDLRATVMIHVPTEELYGYVSDPANDVNWRTGVTESGLTTDPPLSLGSEGHVKAGNQIARWKVTAIAPGVSVDWELTEGPYAGSGGYRPLFARMGRKQNQADVEALKDLLEA